MPKTGFRPLRAACPAMAAEAFYFFLDEKVTKNQVSRDASLRSWPAPCKAGKTAGYVLLPQNRTGQPFCKIPDAPTAAQGRQFYLLSPEAYLLTAFGSRKDYSIKKLE